MATWTIKQLERNTADGGVTVAHYEVVETETVGSGDDAVTYSATGYGSVGFSPDANADDFVAFDNLTEADVIGWVQAQVNQSEVEAALTANIAEQKTPTTAEGLPW